MQQRHDEKEIQKNSHVEKTDEDTNVKISKAARLLALLKLRSKQVYVPLDTRVENE